MGCHRKRSKRSKEHREVYVKQDQGSKVRKRIRDKQTFIKHRLKTKNINKTIKIWVSVVTEREKNNLNGKCGEGKEL